MVVEERQSLARRSLAPSLRSLCASEEAFESLFRERDGADPQCAQPVRSDFEVISVSVSVRPLLLSPTISICAEGRGRTDTMFSRRILNPLRLPFRHFG
jgi:hypothetical protein